MRQAFIEALVEVAAQEPRVWLLTGDLGYSVLERFANRFPDRYVNVGVAEQNMTGVAAGLAMCGKIVFTYSISNFATFRCLEQIRNDVCYHDANVKIVAVGCGLAYGSHGYTHHGVEDLAVLRALPNLTVMAPGDPVETSLAVRAVAEHNGPCYLRLGKGREPVVHRSPPPFRLGQATWLREGKDLCLISTGTMLPTAVEAADLLAARGFTAGVVSMHTLAPLDRLALRLAARQTGYLATLEEHVVTGGLGSAVAEVVAEDAEMPPGTRLVRLGIPASAARQVLAQPAALAHAGLTSAQIAERLTKHLLRRGKSPSGASGFPAG